jgi:hypothetical protein
LSSSQEHRAFVSTLKAQAWEVAKGQLRSIAALQGSLSTGDPTKLKKIQTLTNNFIQAFEDEEFYK